MATEYPIRAVAKLTGLSVDTLRAWERRYAAVVPRRKGRGRAYTEDDVQRLVRLRQAVDRGHSIGQIADLGNSQLDALIAGPQLGEGTQRRRGTDNGLPQEADRLLYAIERFNVVDVEVEMFRLAALMPTRDLVINLILPLLRTVGERWQEGEFSVGQEHLASSMTRNLLGTLIRTGSPQRGAARILIAAPAGELHEFGILASALLAVARGLQVTYLGTNLPGREMIDAALRTEAATVLVGISNPKPPKWVVDELHLIAHGLPERVALWVGGADPERLIQGIERSNVVTIADFESLESQLRGLE